MSRLDEFTPTGKSMDSASRITMAAVLALAICTGWQLFFPESMERWAREDGFFENATALLYAAAAYCFARQAWKAEFPGDASVNAGRFFLLGWTFFAFFVAAEEISWGQRIFGIETPESIKALNYQGEITLHNMQFVYDTFTSSETGIFRANAFSLFMIGNGLIIPLATALAPVRRVIQRFAFPVIPLGYSLIFVLILFYSKLLRSFAVDPTTPPEIAEAFWALGIFLFSLHGLRRPPDVYRFS